VIRWLTNRDKTTMRLRLLEQLNQISGVALSGGSKYTRAR